jgi:hypothetical protein
VLVSFAVPVEDDREVEGLLVGREGAVGITAGRSLSLAHSRMFVKLGGTPHEQLAGMLGVSRSYASRVIQMFKARRILATRRGAILILDAAALAARACCCNDWVKKHLDEVRGAASADG